MEGIKWAKDTHSEQCFKDGKKKFYETDPVKTWDCINGVGLRENSHKKNVQKKSSLDLFSIRNEGISRTAENYNNYI